MSNIKVSNFSEKHKGHWILSCDIEILPWKMILKEIKYFEKGEMSWIALPSRSWKEGEEWYTKELVSFTDNETKEKFRKAVCDAIKEAVKDGIPKESLFKEDEEIPF